jgi:restriction system protein
MSNDLLEVSKAQSHWNSSGTLILRYSINMYHKGLDEHKMLSAPELNTLQDKVNIQARKWSEKWDTTVNKRNILKEKENNLEEARLKNDEAIKAIEDLENLLTNSLSVDATIDWDDLKKSETYSEVKPSKPTPKAKKEYPSKPELKELPAAPSKEIPKFNFVEKLFKSMMEKKTKTIENRYSILLSKWEKENIEVEKLNDSSISLWENQKEEVDKSNALSEMNHLKDLKKWEDDVSAWEKRRDTFLKQQEEFNEKMSEMEIAYLTLKADTVLEYCDMVLNNSDYPDIFLKNFELEYNPENKILIVEYELPSFELFPRVKEVKYVASKKELKESYIPESQVQKMFEETMYKTTLRTIHELFEADTANALEAISFNGWVNAISKTTGKRENNCILSVQVKKNEFLNIELSNVDPKACFKNLKGISSSKLSSLTPIQPILQISKADKRFVEGYEVVNQLDNTTNIAAMDWEDFEHLIRELFEKEFKSNGGEVKVTQASRDGGVDAIAFDPDPIRGGKIVIQAKRYTNTVGVSSVRDLYGTVMNEGATKGILVSTADYGPDAYEFAKGKPLTLLNGSNLLYLLEKHGHHAKIDIREAKRILAEKND